MHSADWTVLVVTDDEDIREVVEDLLVEEEWGVHQAANLQSALRELRSQRFDALLCHLRVLRAEEGRLIREARALQPGAHLVAMTASGPGAGSDEADANLAKPFTRAQLVEALYPKRRTGEKR
jgi:DNA-binding NtrC family response regulator